MNTINVENCKTLLIGRRGENEVATVAFDFTEWASEFGSGVVDLYVKRFGDNSAYPVVLTIDGTIATWTVTATDTNVAGYGKAEYVYRVDGKIAKSAVFPFFVAEDIGQPASEPPDPYESWLEQLTALGAETEAHAQAAEQSAENAAQSAEDAAQSATSAEGYAGQAETAAGLAQDAQTASEAARDAAQAAQASAESSATAASGSAASAAGSATAAAGSASDASSSASAAGASATTASTAAGQAEAAKTAAQTAQSAAEDAAEDAQQAAQQAHVEYEQLSGEVDDLSDEVSQQKSAIEDIAQGIQAYFTQENEYGFFTVTNGAYCAGGSISHAPNYHLYQMTAPKNFTFNCSGEVSDSSHLYICIYSGSISRANNLAKYSNDGNPNLQPLPTTDTTVHAGEILTISYYATSASPKYFKIPSSLIGTYELKDTLPLTEEMKDDVKGIMPGIIVKKVNDGVTSLRVFVPNKRNDDYCIYNFRHYYKKWDSVGSATNLVSADCWGNTTVTDKDGNSIAQGNSNFITLVEGETYHTGDGHGNEVALVVKFIADGVELNYDAMNVNDEVKCSSFRIIQKTNIYKLGGGTANDYNYTYPELNANNQPVIRFRHYLNMEFSIGNDVEIDNRLDVLLDNVRFRQCNAAMLQCNYGRFTDVICNNFESTHNLVSTSGAVSVATDSTVNLSTANEQVCNTVEMYGDGFYISQIMDCLNRGNEDSYVDFRFYEDRVKAYFNPISTGASGTLLNQGDYLNVRNIRKIDI